MSKALQHFVDNFTKGAQIGNSWMEFASKAQDRKDARDIAREKNKLDAYKYSQTYGLNKAKTDAYVNLASANANKANRWQPRGGGGGAGGATLSPGSQQFMSYAAQHGDVGSPPPDSGGTTVINNNSDGGGGDSTPDAPTDVSSDARGGKIPPQRFASGGKARRQQLMSSMMTAGINAANKMNKQAGNPPAPAQPTITRGPSTDLSPQPATGDPTPLQPSAGTNGPGSGYGDTAAPPVTQAISTDYSPPDTSSYDAGAGMDVARRGGRIRKRGVRKFADGGPVDDDPLAQEVNRSTAGSRPVRPPAWEYYHDPMMSVNRSKAAKSMIDYRNAESAITRAGYRKGGAVRRFADGGPVDKSDPTRQRSYGDRTPDRPDRSEGEITPPSQRGNTGVYRREQAPQFAKGGSVDKAWQAQRDAMVDRAAKPDNTNIDRSLREQNDYLSPPGPPTGREQAYRRGGTVRSFADGGDTTPPEGRVVYDEQGKPVWLQSGGPDVPVEEEPRYGGGTYGGNKYGGATPGGATPGGNRFGGNRFGGATYGGATPGGYRTGRRDVPTDQVVRDPGETGGPTEMPDNRPQNDSPDQYYQDDPSYAARTKGGQLPAITVTAKRGDGGQRQGIATGHPWKALTDQTRDEAYDPVKDALDPDNIAAVDREGRTQPHVGQRVIMDANGKTIRVENPVPGGHMETGTDYMSGAVKVAHQVGAQHPQQVYDGTDAPDNKTMGDLMRTIDPQGSMTPQQRMEAAIKSTHEWYMQQGHPELADHAAYDVAQFGVQQSRPFGVAAAKAAQSGNLQQAAQLLTQGYQYLPDQKHAVVHGNQIIVLDKNGKTTMSMPLTQQTIMNLSLGMATGKLGWDVMGYDPPQPAAPPPQAPAIQTQPQVPGTTRPAAQPSAAPAGPTQPPAAPAPQAPAPQVAQASGGASATQTPTGQPNMEPDPSALAPVHPGGGPQPPQQGVRPVVPAPPPPPQAGAGPKPPPPPAQTQPAQTQQPGAGQQPQQPKQPTIEELEQQQMEKAPREPLQSIEDYQSQGLQLSYQQAKNMIRDQYEQERERYLAYAEKIVPKNEWSKSVTPALAAQKARWDAKIKGLDEDFKHKRERMEKGQDLQTTESKPRTMPHGADLKDTQDLIAKRFTDVETNKDPSLTNSALENLYTDRDRAPLHGLALHLWQQNSGMTAEDAANAALALTAISPTGKSPMNHGSGVDALQFSARQNGPRGYVLTLHSGDKVLVNGNTFNDVHALQKKNWTGYQKLQTEQGRKDKELETAKKNLGSRAGKAILDLAPTYKVPEENIPFSFPPTG